VPQVGEQAIRDIRCSARKSDKPRPQRRAETPLCAQSILFATCTTSIVGGVKALSRSFDLGQNLMFARGLSFHGDPVRKFQQSRRVKDSKKGA
jgi:hypothetical protein